jgi:3-deoxy-D-manno-octulosonic acid kinase
MTLSQAYRSYHFGADFELSNQQMDTLISQFQQVEANNEGGLGGRTRTPILQLDGVGPILIKSYYRGGFVRRFTRHTYLRLGCTRSRHEYEILQTLQHIDGVRVPEPVAYASCGGIFYHAWLITKVIPNVQTLAALGRMDPARALKILPDVLRPINQLIDMGLLHVDLHPGNILVDDHNTIFLIDFDKAKTGQAGKERLRRHYTNRWQRAVAKHGLPQELATGFLLT